MSTAAMATVFQAELSERQERQLLTEVATDQGVSEGIARDYVRELRKFLDLAATSPEPLSPSEPVDAAWHRLLATPEMYENLCLQRYGRVLPHCPEQDEEILLRWYRRTRQQMVDRFGSIDTTIWPEDAPAACGVRAPQA